MDPVLRVRLAANPRRLLVFEAARCALFFLPVFYLFFERRLPVDQVLLVQAVYYAAGMALEVPSGFASDRLGRRPTLILAALAQAIGSLVVFGGDSFAVLAIGQVLLASSWSLVSGTDTALLYESLAATDRTEEQLPYEAALSRAGLGALAASALLGGWLGTLHLGATYLATAVLSGAALFVARGLVEPPRRNRAARPRTAESLTPLGRPIPRFVLAASVAGMVYHHVPLEFLQPLVRDALERAGRDSGRGTPWVAGLTLGSTMALGAFATRLVPRTARRLGVVGTLLATLALQGFVLLVLGLALPPIATAVLALRSLPQAFSRPLLRTLLHPELDDRMRATWLSIQNLIGQGVFAGVLAAVGWHLGDLDRLEGPGLRDVLFAFACSVPVALLGLAWLGRSIRRRP